MITNEKISIIIPTYKGEKSLSLLIEILIKNFPDFEIVIVNDRSPDNTDLICKELIKKFEKFSIIYLRLAKNFGEHSAVLAGLSECRGDIAVVIDDDFQHPISEIKKIVNYTKNNDFDVVYTKFKKKKHSLIRNLGSMINDKTTNYLLKKPKNLYLSSFKSIKRNIINELIKSKSSEPYIDAIIIKSTSNIGQVLTDHFERDEKYGKSSYNFKKLISLYLSIFFGYSTAPLRILLVSGVIIFLISLFFSFYIFIEKIINPSLPIGYTSLIIITSLFGGLNFIFIGLIGEYLGKIMNNSNQVLPYLIEKKITSHNLNLKYEE
ncbi:glycosyltransferase [Candidatus Pelagibacter sp.]|nr:glycosyltransferase [Candidatus Pelagibacter sp.]